MMKLDPYLPGSSAGLASPALRSSCETDTAMEPQPPVLDSLRKAVESMPDDVPLRLHLATMLLSAGQRDEAVRHLGAVLQRDPSNGTALALLRDPAPAPPPPAQPGPPATPQASPAAGPPSPR